MNDLGSELGNTMLSQGQQQAERLLSTALDLFKKLYKNWETAPQRKLAKLEYQERKYEFKQRKHEDKMAGKMGYMSYKNLKGEVTPLYTMGITMTRSDMKAFTELCKREGIQFSALVDRRQLGDQHAMRMYEVCCPLKDAPRMAKVIERLNDEKRIDAIDKKIDQIMAKGDKNITQQDRQDIEFLQHQKAAIQQKYCYNVNEQQFEGATQKAKGNKEEKVITFEEALSRYTGRGLDKDANCVVADAKDPSTYIRCHGSHDTYKGRDYVKTQYEVYKKGEQVYATHDGHFDNRPRGYWDTQKMAMKEVGGFSDTVFKFHSVKAYEKWAQQVMARQEVELNPLHAKGDQGRDYGEIKKALEAKLNQLGAVYKQGTVLDKETGNPLSDTKELSIEQRLKVAEAFVVGRQIDNYDKLGKLEVELSIARAEAFTALEGTEQQAVAVGKLEEVSKAYKKSLATEENLKGECMNVHAIKEEQKIRNTENSRALEQTDQEKVDNRREERVNEQGPKQFTLKEVKGEIEAAKDKETKAKGIDMKDKGVHEMPKLPQGKTER